MSPSFGVFLALDKRNNTDDDPDDEDGQIVVAVVVGIVLKTNGLDEKKKRLT